MKCFLLVLCNLAVVFSANIDFAPRGISIRAPGTLTQRSTGSRPMKRHSEHETSYGANYHHCENEECDEAEHHLEPEESDDAHHHHGAQSLKKRQREGVSGSMTALKAFLASLKASLETVQKSSTPQNSPSQAELGTFFSAMLQSKTTLQNAMENVRQAPATKAEMAEFFKASTEKIGKLKQSMVNADKQPLAVNTYFIKVAESVTSLEASMQGKLNPSMFKTEVTSFFIGLLDRTKKLEAVLSK